MNFWFLTQFASIYLAGTIHQARVNSAAWLICMGLAVAPHEREAP